VFQLEGLDHVALTVRDVERSVAWFREVLGLERRYQEAWGNNPAVVGVGNTSLALFPIAGREPKPPPGRDTLTMWHVAFRADRKNFAAAQEELKRRAIPFEFQDHDVSHSIYFQDLDGHLIEITTYEL
jgi:catechol 2,3-dioxygenase-like lactoylglutathione lyase family enzyme